MASPNFSFKGFRLGKNFWSAVKKAIYVLVPAILTETVTNNMLSAGIAGLLGPMVLNAVEYYFRKFK